MPNPYHDETGRFASRDEMRGAIDRLRDSGDVKAALALSLELSDIDYARIQETKSIDAEEFFADNTRIIVGDVNAPAGSIAESQQAGHLQRFDQKVSALQHKDLSSELRDEIINTLRFDERYNLLENHLVAPEVAEALLENQEEPHAPGLTYNNLVWVAIPSLGRDRAAKYATRTASIAHHFWQTHGYLRGNAEFDRQFIKYSHNAGQPGLLTEVARNSSDRETLSLLAQEGGLTSEAFNELASNPNLGNQGAKEVIRRGRNFIGAWGQTRDRLLGNDSVGDSIREGMLHPAPSKALPAEVVESEKRSVSKAISQAKVYFDIARERTTALGMDGRIDTSADYYRARDDQRDAHGVLFGLQAEYDTLGNNLYELHDKQAAERGSVSDRELVNQRVKRAEGYLIWRGDRRAIED